MGPVRRVAVRPAAYKGDSVDTEDVNKKLQEALGNTTNFLQVGVALHHCIPRA